MKNALIGSADIVAAYIRKNVSVIKQYADIPAVSFVPTETVHIIGHTAKLVGDGYV